MLGTIWRTERVYAFARRSEVHPSARRGCLAVTARATLEIEYRYCVFADRIVSRARKEIHGPPCSARAHATGPDEKKLGGFRNPDFFCESHRRRRSARRT